MDSEETNPSLHLTASHSPTVSRRTSLGALGAGALLGAAAAMPRVALAQSTSDTRGGQGRGPTVIPQTPDGTTLVPTGPAGGVKRVTLTAGVVQQELLDFQGKRVVAQAYGYNGSSPGPTLVFTEGDMAEITVINHLPEPTTVHWHGVIVPNSQDGVPDVGQPSPVIQPGQSYTYRFRVVQTGTHMYHSHLDGAKQEMLGAFGGLIFLPKNSDPKVTADYFLFLHEWDMPQSLTPPQIRNMPRTGSPTDTVNSVTAPPNWASNMQNFFTMNGKTFPSTTPITLQLGDRIRVRFGNVGLTAHPIHVHGQDFRHTEQDGNEIPHPMKLNTLVVAPGQTQAFELDAINPGIWPMHCHIAHHAANNLSSGFGGMATRLIIT